MGNETNLAMRVSDRELSWELNRRIQEKCNIYGIFELVKYHN